MKTKAAILYNTREPLVIEDIELPKPEPWQVLVKVVYSGVCHSQLKEVKGERGVDKYLPHLLGHEGSGIVIDIGSQVSKVQPGDKVVLTWIKGTGKDGPGPICTKNGNSINAGAITTFSSYTIVSENRCVKIPSDIPMEISSLFGCAVLTGAGIITNTIQPRETDVLAFFGVGGIGLNALMATKLYDCHTIIAVDINDHKLELAKKFGATHTINTTKEDITQRLSEITNGLGVDYSIEAAGLTVTIEQAFHAVRKNGGLCVFASHPAYGEKIRLDPFDFICGKRIQGSWGGESKPDIDIPIFAELYKEGKLPLEKLITHRYSLLHINHAFQDLEQNKVGRAMIEM